ncbi:MAG: hypothetical protein JWP89_2678 [Schlesneria sp.]|nr:hypothetical protein [Schlesneria sp.]
MITKPECPQCRSTDLRHESGDRFQCNSCLWRCLVTDGRAHSLVDMGSAGTRKARKRLQTTAKPSTDLDALDAMLRGGDHPPVNFAKKYAA